jgi:hypothetical protein
VTPEHDPTRSAPGGLWDAATRAYLLYAGGAAIGSLWLAHLLHHRTLFLDQWRIHHYLITLPFWEAVGRPQAGHRLLFPNLLYHVGNVAFAGDSEFLVAIGLALVAASALALCCAIRSAPGGDRGLGRLACGLVLGLLFWFGNHATLAWALGIGHGALGGAAVLGSLSLFWAGLVALGAAAAGWCGWPAGAAARTAAFAGVVGASALLWPSYLAGVAVAARRTQQIEEAGLGVVVGVRDVERRKRHLFWNLDKLEQVASDLRTRRLNLYRHEWAHLVGTRIEDRFVEVEGRGAALGLVSIGVIRGEDRRLGWMVDGWAWDTRAGRPPQLVLFSDPSGTIRGLARFTREPDVAAAGRPPPGLATSVLARIHPALPAAAGRASGCFGYLQADVPPNGASALAVLADGVSVVRLEALWRRPASDPQPGQARLPSRVIRSMPRGAPSRACRSRCARRRCSARGGGRRAAPPRGSPGAPPRP